MGQADDPALVRPCDQRLYAVRGVVDPAPDAFGNLIVHRHLVESGIAIIKTPPLGLVRHEWRADSYLAHFDLEASWQCFTRLRARLERMKHRLASEVALLSCGAASLLRR